MSGVSRRGSAARPGRSTLLVIRRPAMTHARASTAGPTGRRTAVTTAVLDRPLQAAPHPPQKARVAAMLAARQAAHKVMDRVVAAPRAAVGHILATARRWLSAVIPDPALAAFARLTSRTAWLRQLVHAAGPVPTALPVLTFLPHPAASRNGAPAPGWPGGRRRPHRVAVDRQRSAVLLTHRCPPRRPARHQRQEDRNQGGPDRRPAAGAGRSRGRRLRAHPAPPALPRPGAAPQHPAAGAREMAADRSRGIRHAGAARQQVDPDAPRPGRQPAATGRRALY
jgi:hypothetical protein